MKKTIKLTEADLTRIVKRVIKESVTRFADIDSLNSNYNDKEELDDIADKYINDIASGLGITDEYYEILDKIDDGNVSDEDFDSYHDKLDDMTEELMQELHNTQNPHIDQRTKEYIISYGERLMDNIRDKIMEEERKAQKRAGTLPPKTKWSYPSDFKGGVDEQMEDGDDEPSNVTDSSKIKLSDAKFEKLIDKVYENFGSITYEMAENLRHEIYGNYDQYDDEMDQMYEEKFNQEANKLFDQYMGRIMDKFDLNRDQMDDLTNTMDDILRDAFTG